MSIAAPRLVVLTTGGDYGLHVLHELAHRGVPVAAAVIQADTEVAACFRRPGRLARVWTLPAALARSVHRRRLARGRARRLSTATERVVVTGRRNGARMRRDLRRLAPDVLLLAGVGVLDASLLAIPRLGTLNGHPALLPWVRGNGVVAHSILRGVAAGASCHWVDADIDRGPVVERRLLPVGIGATLPSLEADAVRLAGSLLADVAASIAASGVAPSGTPQATRHPLCHWATPAERRAAELAVNAGEAVRLFERWSGACRYGDPTWRLPADGTVAPG